MKFNSNTIRLYFACFAIAISILFSYTAKLTHATIIPNDDYLYFFYTGIAHDDTELSKANDNYILNKVRSSEASKQQYDRYDLRANYNNNYLVNSITYYLSYKMFCANRSCADSSSFEISKIYLLAMSLIFPICLILLYTTIFFTSNNFLRDIFAVSIAIIICAFLTYAIDLYVYLNENYLHIRKIIRFKSFLNLFDGVGQSYYNIAAGKNWTNMIFAAYSSLISPHIDFTPFGYSARCSFLLLVILVFVFRLNGKFFASYFIIFMLLFFHQSNAGLLMAFLIPVDVILRPRVIFSNKTFNMMILILFFYILNEKIIFFNGNFDFLFFSGFSAALFLLFLAFNYKSKVVSFLENLPLSLFLQKLSNNYLLIDYLFVATLWFFTLPIAHYFHFQLVSEGITDYIFEQIHGRSLIILRLGFLVSLAYFFIDFFTTRIDKLKMIFKLTLMAFLFFISLIPAIHKMKEIHGSIITVDHAFSDYEKKSRELMAAENIVHHEDLIYYLLVKSIIAKKPISQYIK